ncbi:uncharacterized protein LOC119981656 isoform X2 [Tripterygium wilfordii]|uniref:uncharacterized protein LOC119981656 isoform X2 n=1 Tax=Tripterygium wilfordii TaxID=458696 RepID=UPI0018F82724|nr:uncharacterized protein LOC119981656 isoform X2 [Tripterygium wilfordii]
MAAANKGNVGLQERLSRRPSHVPNVETISGDAKNRRHQQGHRRGHSNLPVERPQSQNSKGSQRGHQRPKIPNYPPPRGSGMQAVFLDTWQKSPGTGVFFPHNGNKFGPGMKSGSHVALIPFRVIEALKKNGHTLGPKIANHQDNNNNAKDRDGDGDAMKSNEGNEKSTQRCSLSQNENTSPELFLPKEWTY